jgi:hypothetical protein
MPGASSKPVLRYETFRHLSRDAEILNGFPENGVRPDVRYRWRKTVWRALGKWPSASPGYGAAGRRGARPRLFRIEPVKRFALCASGFFRLRYLTFHDRIGVFTWLSDLLYW